MNGIENDAISTILVTPEDGFSYASFEAVGYDLKSSFELTILVEKVLAVFQPSEFSVSLHGYDLRDYKSMNVKGYGVKETSFEDLGDGGLMMYCGFHKEGGCSGSPRSILNGSWSESEDEDAVKNCTPGRFNKLDLFDQKSWGCVGHQSSFDRCPTTPAVVVTSGYDGKWIWAKSVLPADWKIGGVYDSVVQIDDIAQEGCGKCYE